MVELAAEGGLAVRTPKYRARLGPDGNLHSLVVGGAEFLDDSVSVSLGCFLYSPAEGPRRFSRVTFFPPQEVEASDATHTQRFRFLPEAIEITLTHRAERPPSYFMVFSREVRLATNADTGEAASTPATEPWPQVRLTAETGAFVEIGRGTRIWGPWSERQVWELSRLAPGAPQSLRILVGEGPSPRPRLSELLGLALQVTPKERVAPEGGELTVTAEVENRSERPLAGELTLDLAAQREEVSLHLSKSLSVAARGKASAEFPLKLTEPDFYDARLGLQVEKESVKQLGATLGYGPEKIAASYQPPPGLRSFWREVGERVAGLSLDPEVRIEAVRSTPQVSVCRVSFASVGGSRLSGWYCRPMTPGPHPGLLYLPGPAAQSAPPEVFARMGYAALTIEVPASLSLAGKSGASHLAQAAGSPGSPERSPLSPADSVAETYRELAAHGLQALAFLRSREEVDGERIVISGTSEGGGLALILAALDPRIAAVAADAPMPCDVELSLRVGGWPYRALARRLEADAAGAPALREALGHVDVLGLSSWVRPPVLLSVGMRDPISLASAVFGFFNRLTGTKEIKLYPEAGHEGGGLLHWKYKFEWFERVLEKPPPAPGPLPPE